MFIFEEIFCWIAWITFRWIAVLFSFHLNSHKNNYASKECKKELKKSRWLNNMHIRLISRVDFVCFWKSLLIILLNKERQRVSLAKLNQITSQNLVKTLRTFHKMIWKSKKFSPAEGFFPRYTRKFLRINFVLLIQTLHCGEFINRLCKVIDNLW